LFDLLKLQESSFDPTKAKVHLARHNSVVAPIDVYLRGEFDEWQRWQRRRNFERDLVVSLVRSHQEVTRWLFVGLFRARGCESHLEDERPHYMYNLERIPTTAEFEGRLFVRSVYKERQTYVYGETVSQDLSIEELLPERMNIGRFPGYKALNISKADLDLVMRHNIESWRTALASVKGIYLVTDIATGKLYVGKADGETGIWGRWCQYSSTGHGNNKALINELGQEAGVRQQDLRFSLLEIADLQSGPGEIERRESHWKEILQTRQSGYNRN
jgi:hypothetical protein